MKNKVVEYIASCIECQQVKSEHQHLTSLLQALPIPNWKWEVICLDFITSLPKNQKQNDAIMVVMETLSKETHFIPIKTNHKAANIADIFMKEIFQLNGILKVIIPDIDP